MHVKIIAVSRCMCGWTQYRGRLYMSQISRGVPGVILLLLIGTCLVSDHSRLFRPLNGNFQLTCSVP